ncbi:MAG: hypothetical protein CMI52_02165 [Parcubacteria group bacterium]|mgnify:CR=1 FL=1|nr:hypothetical protein [Parcubacteria group bacterium]|tara:strand:- start:265 stop:789 length:525 start_codon:yes stop_codon:yes gene_type:complete
MTDEMPPEWQDEQESKSHEIILSDIRFLKFATLMLFIICAVQAYILYSHQNRISVISIGQLAMSESNSVSANNINGLSELQDRLITSFNALTEIVGDLRLDYRGHKREYKSFREYVVAQAYESKERITSIGQKSEFNHRMMESIYNNWSFRIENLEVSPSDPEEILEHAGERNE